MSCFSCTHFVKKIISQDILYFTIDWMFLHNEIGYMNKIIFTHLEMLKKLQKFVQIYFIKGYQIHDYLSFLEKSKSFFMTVTHTHNMKIGKTYLA